MSDQLAPTKVLSYALLRVAFGVNFAGHGLVRILNGIALFAATTADHMTKSLIPRPLVIGFSSDVPFIEAAPGLALTSAAL